MRTLLIVALIAPLCPAADLTGTWFGEVKWNGADHPQDVCISLWTGKGVSGVITLDGRDSLDISSGHLEDDRIDFASGATSFHLNNLGDQLTGAAQTDSRQGSVSLERLNPMRGGSPVPIRRPNPEYTPEARAARLEGDVLLDIEILPSGAVADTVKVVRGLGMGLDEKAVVAAMKWRLSPLAPISVPFRTRAHILMPFRLP